MDDAWLVGHFGHHGEEALNEVFVLSDHTAGVLSVVLLFLFATDV